MEVVASVCLAIGRKGRLAFSSDSMLKMVQSIFFLGNNYIYFRGGGRGGRGEG